MLPTLLCDMSEERELIYRMILHTILYFGVFIFWIKGKNWRDNFAEESQDRHLHNTQFDPIIADVMISLIDEDKLYSMHE